MRGVLRRPPAGPPSPQCRRRPPTLRRRARSAPATAAAAIGSVAANGAAAANAAAAASAAARRRAVSVFVGAMGLIGTEPLVRALPRPLARLLCLHTFVLLLLPPEPEGPVGGEGGREEEEESEEDGGGGRNDNEAAGRSARRGRRRTPPPRLLLLDFVPERPTHPATAAALLTGRGVPGVARARAMAAATRFEAVAPVVRPLERWGGDHGAGPSLEARAVAAGEAVAASPLRLFGNDCRTHTAAVLTAALGRPVSRAEVARLISVEAGGEAGG